MALSTQIKIVRRAFHEAQINCASLDLARSYGCNIPASAYQAIWDHYHAVVKAVQK